LGEPNESKAGAGAAEKPRRTRTRTVVITAVSAAIILLVAGSLYTRSINKRPAPSAATVSKTAQMPAKTGDPNRVAQPGEQLLRVVDPPASTRSEIKLNKDLGTKAFAIKLEPFGLVAGSRAVIKVTGATANGGSALASEFATSLKGQNLLVRVDAEGAAAMKTGGLYTARLTLVDSGGASSFELSNVVGAR
jgi:hypothetical protein